jgi:tripartite-type tricarboxylate transporter receptor subunit TctC
METGRRHWIGGAGALALAAGMPVGSRAQAWPVRPIRVIVGYPPGGVLDVMARVVGERVAAVLGQPVVVENRTGANSNIAVDALLASPADGYTWLVSSNFLSVNPVLEPTLRWRSDAFTPVARFALSPNFLVVPANAPFATLADWIAEARRSGRMQFGDGGAGSTPTLAMRRLERDAGIRLESVYYKGGAQMIQDMLGGQLPCAMMPSTVSIPPVQAGRLRALVTTGEQRSPALPGVPTMAEAGFPNATAPSWYGIHVAAGTPADVVRRAARAIEDACAAPEVRARLVAAGGEAAYLEPERFSSFIQTESARWMGLLEEVRRMPGQG